MAEPVEATYRTFPHSGHFDKLNHRRGAFGCLVIKSLETTYRTFPTADVSTGSITAGTVSVVELVAITYIGLFQITDVSTSSTTARSAFDYFVS